MVCPIAFQHQAKNKELLMTGFEENFKKLQFLMLNPPYLSPQRHAKFQRKLMKCLRDI